MLLISPEEEPTGYQGACSVEEFGYEIRDAIALLDQPDDFHYVAKPSGKERHAGVIEHEDETTGRFVQNSHETVKPVGMMRALLQDVPVGEGPVVDPFLGSGTTGLACLYTKHDFVGIEQSADYLVIADQRVRHWDRAVCAWDGAEVVSEAAKEEDAGPLELADLFGFDEEGPGECPVCLKPEQSIEIKEKGKRLEVCSECAEDRERVRSYLEDHPERH